MNLDEELIKVRKGAKTCVRIWLNFYVSYSLSVSRRTIYYCLSFLLMYIAGQGLWFSDVAETFWHLFSGQVMLTENRFLFYLRFTWIWKTWQEGESFKQRLRLPWFWIWPEKIINSSNWNLLLEFRFSTLKKYNNLTVTGLFHNCIHTRLLVIAFSWGNWFLTKNQGQMLSFPKLFKATVQLL